jgi:hypothetical protein
MTKKLPPAGKKSDGLKVGDTATNLSEHMRSSSTSLCFKSDIEIFMHALQSTSPTLPTLTKTIK